MKRSLTNIKKLILVFVAIIWAIIGFLFRILLYTFLFMIKMSLVIIAVAFARSITTW